MDFEGGKTGWQSSLYEEFFFEVIILDNRLEQKNKMA
jgi:hypothetical protein